MTDYCALKFKQSEARWFVHIQKPDGVVGSGLAHDGRCPTVGPNGRRRDKEAQTDVVHGF